MSVSRRERKLAVWDAFCRRHRVLERSAPLFAPGEALVVSETRLRRETRFRVEAWRKGGVGLWREYGETSLTFPEYQLIGVASDLFADTLLHTEGVHRCRRRAGAEISHGAVC